MVRTILSLLFRLAVRLRAYLYSAGLLRSYKVNARVISVGNISVGGAGKTPLVLLLNDRLRSRGFKTAILEKGYKSGLSHNEIIMAEKGRDAMKEGAIGDEPLMVWKQIPSGTRLAVSSDKTEAARAVKNNWPDTNLMIVDDGFQHLKLKRDLDIVLIEVSQGFKGKVMPLGRLREPYSSLDRAGVVLFTKADGMTDEEKGKLRDKATGINPSLKVFFSTVKFMTSLPISGKRVFPLSAIYDPAHFHRKIRETGAEFDKYMAFSDHYEFSSSVLEGVLKEAEKSGAEYIVVTSKDWVKIRPFISENKKVIESWYEHQIDNEGEFIKCCI